MSIETPDNNPQLPAPFEEKSDVVPSSGNEETGVEREDVWKQELVDWADLVSVTTAKFLSPPYFGSKDVNLLAEIAEWHQRTDADLKQFISDYKDEITPTSSLQVYIDKIVRQLQSIEQVYILDDFMSEDMKLFHSHFAQFSNLLDDFYQLAGVVDNALKGVRKRLEELQSSDQLGEVKASFAATATEYRNKLNSIKIRLEEIRKLTNWDDRPYKHIIGDINESEKKIAGFEAFLQNYEFSSEAPNPAAPEAPQPEGQKDASAQLEAADSHGAELMQLIIETADRLNEIDQDFDAILIEVDEIDTLEKLQSLTADLVLLRDRLSDCNSAVERLKAISNDNLYYEKSQDLVQIFAKFENLLVRYGNSLEDRRLELSGAIPSEAPSSASPELTPSGAPEVVQPKPEPPKDVPVVPQPNPSTGTAAGKPAPEPSQPVSPARSEAPNPKMEQERKQKENNVRKTAGNLRDLLDIYQKDEGRQLSFGEKFFQSPYKDATDAGRVGEMHAYLQTLKANFTKKQAELTGLSNSFQSAVSELPTPLSQELNDQVVRVQKEVIPLIEAILQNLNAQRQRLEDEISKKNNLPEVVPVTTGVAQVTTAPEKVPSKSEQSPVPASTDPVGPDNKEKEAKLQSAYDDLLEFSKNFQDLSRDQERLCAKFFEEPYLSTGDPVLIREKKEKYAFLRHCMEAAAQKYQLKIDAWADALALFNSPYPQAVQEMVDKVASENQATTFAENSLNSLMHNLERASGKKPNGLVLDSLLTKYEQDINTAIESNTKKKALNKLADPKLRMAVGMSMTAVNALAVAFVPASAVAGATQTMSQAIRAGFGIYGGGMAGKANAQRNLEKNTKVSLENAYVDGKLDGAVVVARIKELYEQKNEEEYLKILKDLCKTYFVLTEISSRKGQKIDAALQAVEDARVEQEKKDAKPANKLATLLKRPAFSALVSGGIALGAMVAAASIPVAAPVVSIAAGIGQLALVHFRKSQDEPRQTSEKSDEIAAIRSILAQVEEYFSNDIEQSDELFYLLEGQRAVTGKQVSRVERNGAVLGGGLAGLSLLGAAIYRHNHETVPRPNGAGDVHNTPGTRKNFLPDSQHRNAFDTGKTPIPQQSTAAPSTVSGGQPVANHGQSISSGPEASKSGASMADHNTASNPSSQIGEAQQEAPKVKLHIGNLHANGQLTYEGDNKVGTDRRLAEVIVSSMEKKDGTSLNHEDHLRAVEMVRHDLHATNHFNQAGQLIEENKDKAIFDIDGEKYARHAFHTIHEQGHVHHTDTNHAPAGAPSHTSEVPGTTAPTSTYEQASKAFTITGTGSVESGYAGGGAGADTSHAHSATEVVGGAQNTDAPISQETGHTSGSVETDAQGNQFSPPPPHSGGEVNQDTDEPLSGTMNQVVPDAMLGNTFTRTVETALNQHLQEVLGKAANLPTNELNSDKLQEITHTLSNIMGKDTMKQTEYAQLLKQAEGAGTTTFFGAMRPVPERLNALGTELANLNSPYRKFILESLQNLKNVFSEK